MQNMRRNSKVQRVNQDPDKKNKTQKKKQKKTKANILYVKSYNAMAHKHKRIHQF